MEFNLADVFEAVADGAPDNEALVCGDVRLTFADLERRSNQLAHALAARGIGEGDHVALHLYNGNQYIEGMIAAFKLRAVPINVNYRYVADELRYLFSDSDAKAVIHEEDFAPVINSIKGELPQLKTMIARGEEYETALAEQSGDRDFGPRSGDDLYILYTGGTTGMPKGVMWRNEDILFGAMAGGVGPTDTRETIAERVKAGRTRCMPICPFMHGTAHWMSFSALFGGGTIVVSPDKGMDPDRLWQVVADEKVTFLVMVGDAQARPMLDALESDPERFDLSGLSVILSGGAILSPTLKEQFAKVLPSTIVVDGYGASETGGQGQMVSAPGTAGGHPRFRMGEDTQVLDEDYKPLEPGSGRVGRVARKGRIPLGYYKDPEKSAVTFPVIDGVRWSVPGDMGTLDEDGVITLFGRGSVSINTGGEKVYPEEVEAALKSHPAVFDAVVVGVPDERWGERVVAVVAAREGAEVPSEDALAAHAREHIAGYKVPRSAVMVDAIVRSPSGKPDYRWAKATAMEALGIKPKA